MKRLIQSLFVFLLITNVAFAQNRTITGTVTGKDDGLPLPGVSVKIVGSAGGAITAADGRYSVSVPLGSTALTFSFIGYTTQTLTIGNSSTINVALATDAQQLGEVVVTANNIVREARSLGYAATSINTSELTRARERSVLNSLQGKVAGVQITSSSGGPGSSSRVVIRGGTSLTGNNQALFVVDGMPIDNSSQGSGDNLNNSVDAGNRANDLNPDDIESMTILKGPTAAALYGSRASNGAIIITTKNGKGLKGKSEITLNSGITFENILKLPDFQNEYGQGGKMVYDSRENFSWGPKFDGIVRPWGQEILGEQRVKPYVGLPDNVKNFFETGRTLNNSVSLSQGGEKTTYYLSFGNIDQKGTIPGTKYGRTSVKLAGTSQISDKIYSNATITYVRSTGDLSVQGQNNSAYNSIIGTPRDIPITELEDYKNNKFNTLSGYYGAYTVNPYYLLGEDSYRSTVDRVLGTIQVGYKPFKWLDLSYRIGTDVSSDQRTQATSKRVFLDVSNQNFASTNYKGRYEESAFNVREINSDFMAMVKKDFSEALKFSGTLGFNNRQRDYNSRISTAAALVVPGLYNLSNVDGTPTASNRKELRRLNGVYADLNLAYNNYLFLGVTGRNDWSSTLPKGNNSFFYPSVNASFVFTDALKISSDIFNFGKVRAGFAQVGNDADVYLLNSVYTKGTIDDGYQDSQVDFPLDGVPGFEVGNRIGNPRLKPEITTSFEAGLDLSFFGDRIGLEATYYVNNSKDQIFNVPISPASGYTAKTINAGSLQNKGIELLLRVTPVKVSGFRWDLTTTFTKNKSLVKELFNGVDQLSIGGLGSMTLVAKLGEPYGAFYGTDNMRDPNGNVVVDPDTGYPLQASTPQILGNIQPKFMLGFNNSFSYKGVTLTGVLDVKRGGKVYSNTKSSMEFLGTTPLTLYNDRQAFVIPNSVVQNTDGTFSPNTIPVTDAQDYWTDHRTEADQLIDASFVKLREVTLSYQLPADFVKKTPFSGLQIGVSGRNLAIWTPKENIFIDPEVSSFGNNNGSTTVPGTQGFGNVQGFEFGSIPSMRSMTVNLRVTF